MSRSHRKISLLIVSSNASRTRELHLSRFWYYVLVGLVCTGLASMIVVAVISPYLAGIIMAETAGQPWKEQLKTAQNKTRQLTQELAEMQQIAKSIRQLAGVVDFEASAPAPVTEYTSFVDETTEISLREKRKTNVDNSYGRRISDALKFLKKHGQRLLTKEYLQIYSPKFLKILENFETTNLGRKFQVN